MLNPEIAAKTDLPIVHTFGTTTPQHEVCRDLLLRCGIKDVCMESTGIYKDDQLTADVWAGVTHTNLCRPGKWTARLTHDGGGNKPQTGTLVASLVLFTLGKKVRGLW